MINVTHVNLVTKDLGWWPMDKGLVLIDAIYHQSSSPAYIVDGFVREFLHPCSLHNDVESVRIFCFKRLPLRFRVLAVEFNVFVSSFEFLRNVHLDAFVGCDYNSGGTIELQELRQYKARRASAKKENLDTDWWVELIETMDSAGGGLQKSCLFVS